MDSKEGVLQGVAGSSGFAHGAAAILTPIELDHDPFPIGSPDEEIASLRESLDEVAADLEARASGAAGDLMEILEAQSMMVRDAALYESATAMIREHGLAASKAIVDAGERYASKLEEGSSQYIRERAADVRDVCKRVALHLRGIEDATIDLRAPRIVVARDLSPADVAGMDPRFILGFATEEGSRTCHAAIVARSMRVPAVLAVKGLLQHLSEGDDLALDGDEGTVYPNPQPEVLSGLRDRSERRARRRNELIAALDGAPAGTSDGHLVELGANIGNESEIGDALALGAEAVGLFRTELMFQGRTSAPTVDEQAASFGKAAKALGGRRLVIRTFDFGADKPVPFLDMPDEPNPALGVRGLRLGVAHPELLADQLRAVAEVAAGGHRLAVMAPMVGTVEEAEWFRAQARLAGCDDAGAEVGIMIEIPSAALLAEELCEIMDFVSIGTNDLTQYLLAADRQLGPLTRYQDAFSPAVLRSIGAIGTAAGGRDCWVGVCGEAASDPLWALVAVGLGVTELSMAGEPLLEVRAALASTTLERCRAIARAAVSSRTAEDARKKAAEEANSHL